MNEIIQADVIRTGPEWASIIRNDLNRAVEGIITAGQHLTQAKSDVNHGEWEPMLNGIGISRAWAAKLMKIGQSPALSNVNQGLHLPASIKALHELSQLDPEDIERGMEGGTIHPEMTTQDAKNMKSGSKETTPFEKAMKNLKALQNNIDGGLSPNELKEVLDATQRVIDTTGQRR